MKNIFEHTSASWVKYSDYEWRTTEDGKEYLLPTKDAMPKPYDPMKDADNLVLAAADIGLMLFHKNPEKAIKAAMQAFACKYGLLGIMTALPTTANFITYEKVYYPKNDLIPAETMETEDYLHLFYPFRKPDFRKWGVESSWSFAGDNLEQAILLTFPSEPQAMAMSFMRDYGEPYVWLASVFKDWAFALYSTTFYYDRKDRPDPEARALYERGIAAFEDNAPTYHLELRDRPTLVWDFHSLLVNIKLLIFLALTDENNPLKVCRKCGRPFIAKKANDNYCSEDCRGKRKKSP